MKQIIDEKQFRQEMYQKLQEFKDQFEQYLSSPQGHKTLSALRHAATLLGNTLQKEKMRKMVRQIEGIKFYIDQWQHLSVVSHKQFEFFILTKADEIGEGSSQDRYDQALLMRQDQLGGLIATLDKLRQSLNRFEQLTINQIQNDQAFIHLTTHTLEDQVYEEAENCFQKRLKTGI